MDRVFGIVVGNKCIMMKRNIFFVFKRIIFGFSKVFYFDFKKEIKREFLGVIIFYFKEINF